MENLLKETENVLFENGKTFDDLIVAAGSLFRFPISIFRKLADTEYDHDFGAPKVAEDLVLIGKNFWLERQEYDGKEWWEYKEMPKYDDLPVLIPKSLTVEQAYKNGEDITGGWESLYRLNMKALPGNMIRYDNL